MLSNMKITEFLAATSSDAPVPGGGSVAALSAAIASSLTEMVANLTVGKKGYDEVQDEMKAISEKMSSYTPKFVDFIDKDASSFDEVMKSFKLPKDTDEEKKARTEAIQNGMKLAATVPLETARAAMEILGMIEAVVVRGNNNAVTDGAVAAMMTRTAVLSALFNTKINLGSIKDAAFVEAAAAEVAQIEKDVVEMEARILAQVKL
jgi:formiminotetrahydrofolate cyclodeaminase